LPIDVITDLITMTTLSRDKI